MKLNPVQEATTKEVLRALFNAIKLDMLRFERRASSSPALAEAVAAYHLALRRYGHHVQACEICQLRMAGARLGCAVAESRKRQGMKFSLLCYYAAGEVPDQELALLFQVLDDIDHKRPSTI